jgi:hypothetical protein
MHHAGVGVLHQGIDDLVSADGWFRGDGNSSSSCFDGGPPSWARLGVFLGDRVETTAALLSLERCRQTVMTRCGGGRLVDDQRR